MIPEYYIKEWHEQVPWNSDAMVEQDPMEAYEQVRAAFIEQLPGKRE